MAIIIIEHIQMDQIPVLNNPLGIDVPGGARGVMVTVVGNGHGDTNSNPGRD